MKTTTKYESGATSHAVNDLILFSDNTNDLTEKRDKVYQTIRLEKAKGKLTNDNDTPLYFSWFINECIEAYKKEFPKYEDHKHIIEMTDSQRFEFQVLYASEYENWYYENPTQNTIATPEFINKIASKLTAEDVTKENYNKDKAIKILSRCVLPKPLIRVLESNENDIIKLLN